MGGGLRKETSPEKGRENERERERETGCEGEKALQKV